MAAFQRLCVRGFTVYYGTYLHADTQRMHAHIAGLHAYDCRYHTYMHAQLYTVRYSPYMYTTAVSHDCMYVYTQPQDWYSPVHDYRTGTHLCTTTPLVLPVHNYRTGTHLCTTTGLVLTCARLQDWYSPVHDYWTGTHLCMTTGRVLTYARLHDWYSPVHKRSI